ncbi:MAG: hypothetical protein JST36_10380 [Bacteroidetes bacterium]|nr:hypothetical protein [Bacteroidota bacterium]
MNVPSHSPYHALELNPIWKVDPKGNSATHYDTNGKKIDDLGGDKIDFFAQKNGDTKVVDNETKASTMIPNGESLIQGFSQRDASVGPRQIYKEWDGGYGPSKSIFASFNGEKSGPFESLRSPSSLYTKGARQRILGSEDLSGRADVDTYGKFNPLIANDMWEQMIGRAGVQWFKLGDKALFMVNDRKSLSSFVYHIIPESWNFERSTRPSYGANTYQTYIWTESMTEVKNSTTIFDNRKEQQERMMMLNRARSVPFGPK